MCAESPRGLFQLPMQTEGKIKADLSDENTLNTRNPLPALSILLNRPYTHQTTQSFDIQKIITHGAFQSVLCKSDVDADVYTLSDSCLHIDYSENDTHLSHLFQPRTAFVQEEAKICGVELAIMISIDLLKKMPEPLCRVHSAQTCMRCLLWSAIESVHMYIYAHVSDISEELRMGMY